MRCGALAEPLSDRQDRYVAIGYAAPMLVRRATNRRTLLYVLALDVVLWVIGSTAFNGETTTDNTWWTIVFVVLAVLVVLSVVALARWAGSRARTR